MMGSPESEHGRRHWEQRHPVTLSRGFWMLETQVTQAMWESIMGNNPSYFRGDKRPVENVSWVDFQEYIEKLNELLAGTPGAPEGFKFSLPTEAQWEYACRAGTTTAYHFGDTITQGQANFRRGQTTDVGSFRANAWGLYDMHGNVSEWCLDWLGWDYPNHSVIDPVGVSSGSRALRGGAYHNMDFDCRSAIRFPTNSSLRSSHNGFRLALVCAEHRRQPPGGRLPASAAQADTGWDAPFGFTHKIVFEPAGDFVPRNARDYLNVLDPRLAGTRVHSGYFRPKVQDGKLIAQFLTTTPDEYRQVIESIPQFKYIDTVRLTQEMFEAYEKTVQESLP